MAIISGGMVIEGARHRGAAGENTDGSLGLFQHAGVPVDGVSGTEANIAAKGALLVDITNANVYVNGGTLASPLWKLVTRAA